MKRFRELITRVIILVSMLALLSACGSLSLSTPTVTPIPPTMTLTPTLTFTPTPTFTPTVTSTPIEQDESGSPLFPESSTSYGDGFEFAISQRCLNMIGIKGVNIPYEVMNDWKNILVGQWLKLLNAPRYNSVNAYSASDLAKANENYDGYSMFLMNQPISLGIKTNLVVKYVCSKEEYDSLRSSFLAKTDNALVEGDTAFLYGSQLGTQSFTHLEGSTITFVHTTKTGSAKLGIGHPTKVIANMLYVFTVRSSYVILCEGRGLSVSDAQHYCRMDYPDNYLHAIIHFKSNGSKTFSTKVLGGCVISIGEGCILETEQWKFNIIQ